VFLRVDHVIVFGEDGKIIEEGSPRELRGRNGEFGKLLDEARNELNLDAKM
jgi:ABC-type multidrug transport system fused ATPase/permease subunit